MIRAHAHRLGRLVAGFALVASGLAAVPAPVLADTTSATGDEYVTASTPWATWAGKTPAQITTLLGTTMRLVDLRQDPAGTYTATAVKNSGAYATAGWWWFYHRSIADVSAFVGANNARIISLQRNADGTVNVVMVSNTGVAARAWWWYVGVTTAQATTIWQTNNARIVSVTADPTAAGTYDVLMIANSGADSRTWWWWVNATPSFLSSTMSSVGARLTDLEPNPDGTFNAVMIKATGADNVNWWWYFGGDAAWMARRASSNGARISRMAPYSNGVSTVYAVVMVDNLAAEPRRVWSLLQSGYTQQGLSNANFGFFVAEVGGTTKIALQQGTAFEPASAIKALYNLYAEYQVQIGNDDLANPFTYWVKPTDPANKDVCPLDYANTASNDVQTTLSDGLGKMMSVSDNRTTQGVDLRYGRANVNAFAKIIGMPGTVIRQTLGCGNRFGGSVATTLSDLSRLYVGVYTHQLLTSTRASTFFTRMNGGALSSTDPLADVIRSEATSLGKSATVASSFIAAVRFREKGGSYDNCPLTGTCNPPYLYDRSDAGYLTLPWKSGGVVASRTYTYGWWVNDLTVPCGFGTTCAARTQADATTGRFRPEIFRALVRAALQTW